METMSENAGQPLEVNVQGKLRNLEPKRSRRGRKEPILPCAFANVGRNLSHTTKFSAQAPDDCSHEGCNAQ